MDGARTILAEKKCKVTCCTYHRQDDALFLKSFFEEYKYDTEFSKKFMLFYQLIEFIPPYFRKGIYELKIMWSKSCIV